MPDCRLACAIRSLIAEAEHPACIALYWDGSAALSARRRRWPKRQTGVGSRKGQTVTLRQVTRRVPARHGATRQIHTLTSRDDLTAGEVCWRLSSRWREENYFRYARTLFALDALDSYAATPDDPDRMVPNPARKTAAARIRQVEAAAQAAEAARDAALLQLRSPRPRPGRLPHQPGDQRPGRPGRGRLPRPGRSRAGCGGHPGPGSARRARPGHGPPGRRDQADHPRHPDGWPRRCLRSSIMAAIWAR
jgi:hypothetical protein